jgi:CheY-like chemotaxis protein
MDVVHETMRKLRGSADVQSVQGQGSTFTLALPLTLAIRQVLLLRVQGEMLALPLDNVERTVEVGLHQLNDVADRQILEGPHGPFPLIQLDCVLGGATPQVHHTANRHVICVEVHGNRYGLVCDGLEGKQEIVVKSLGDILVNVPCAAGATLVGEKVVIILDLPALIARWKGEVTSQPHAVESPRQDLARFKVLIVEDSAPTRALLSDLYRQLGFAVTEATDGEQALALAQEKPFDLVSTDARMPHMDGYTLARRLRKNPLSKHTPILMISARGERVDKVRGFDAGVDGYLVKPIDAAKLADVVSRLIDQQKPTAEQENTP